MIAGGKSIEEVFSLTPEQIEFLYEFKEREKAGERALFISDLATAINGVMGEESHKAMIKTIELLRAIEDGTYNEGDGYTDNEVIQL